MVRFHGETGAGGAAARCRPFPLPRALRAVQDEIAACCPHPHYLRAYRAEEFGYWGPVSRWLERLARREAGRLLLDAGCAYGTLLFFSRRLGFRARALDRTGRFLSPRLLRRYRTPFLRKDLESPTPLPPSWSGFRVILLTEILEHLNYQPVPTLRRLTDLLAADGELLLSTPDADAGWGPGLCDVPFDELPPRRAPIRFVDGHVKTYRAAELERLLQTAGLRPRLYQWRLPGRAGHLLARARVER